MSLPDQTPKLPKLPFLLGDFVLLATAWYIAYREAGPVGVPAMAAVTACVIVAAVLGTLPFVLDYGRKKDEGLDERQHGLEALSRTINTAAEQISIATNGLNELTDLTHKNLKQAEQLPHKLQEKIAEFNAQLDNARENDREELEKELSELRSSETDRLQSVSDQVHKAIGELTRLETGLQQQISSRSEQIERAHIAFSKHQVDAASALQDAYAALTRDLASAQAKALVEIDRKLAERTAAAISAIESAASRATHHKPSENTPVEASMEQTTTLENSSEVATPLKRPRKARREETSPAGAVSTETDSPSASTTIAAANDIVTAPPPFSEPPPIPAETIAQIQPVAPASAEPFPLENSPAQIPSNDSPPVTSGSEVSSPSIPPESATAPAGEQSERTARKRAARKPVADPGVDTPFQLASEGPSTSEDTPVNSAETVEPAISSDGATRLIATSYIGIGNRLFIRGEGPGLSWEKGVPLQFISIGKWRWETAEATTPIRFKLFKNDEVECPGLGTVVVEPGRQQEVTAKF
jgi:hypothetical protein